jgi:hypothetical protein
VCRENNFKLEQRKIECEDVELFSWLRIGIGRLLSTFHVSLKRWGIP